MTRSDSQRVLQSDQKTMPEPRPSLLPSVHLQFKQVIPRRGQGGNTSGYHLEATPLRNLPVVPLVKQITARSSGAGGYSAFKKKKKKKKVVEIRIENLRLLLISETTRQAAGEGLAQRLTLGFFLLALPRSLIRREKKVLNGNIFSM